MNRKLYAHIAARLSAIENCRKSGNTEWLDKHTDAIEQLVKNLMPHGSGFDSGTTFDFDKSTSEKLVFNTAFHHMDENGFYAGWTDHTVTVTPSLQFDFNLKIGGRNRNGIKEYMHEQFDYLLSKEIDDVDVIKLVA